MKNVLILFVVFVCNPFLFCQEDQNSNYFNIDSRNTNLQDNFIFSLKNINNNYKDKNRIYFGNTILKSEVKFITSTNIYLKSYFSYGINSKNYYQYLDDEFFIGEAGSNNISTIPNNYSLTNNLGFGLGYVINIERRSNFLFDLSIETGKFFHQSATLKEYQTYRQGWFIVPFGYWDTDSTKIEYDISSVKYTRLNVGLEYLFRLSDRFSIGLELDILFGMPRHYRVKEFNVRNGATFEKEDVIGDIFNDIFGGNNEDKRTHFSFGLNLNYNIATKRKS